MLPYLIVGGTFGALGGGISLIAVAEIRSWQRPTTTSDAGCGTARYSAGQHGETAIAERRAAVAS